MESSEFGENRIIYDSQSQNEDSEDLCQHQQPVDMVESYSHPINYSHEESFSSSCLNSQQDDWIEENIEEEVSFQKDMFKEHLNVLEDLTTNITSSFCDILQNFEDLDYWYQDYQPKSLETYLLLGGHYLGGPEGKILLQILNSASSLRRVAEWIFNSIHPLLSEELLLILGRVLLAYIPVRAKLGGTEQISSISLNFFNIQNIYCHPNLKILSLSRVFQPYLNIPLLSHYQVLLTTLLLIIEQYFQNPFFPYSKYINSSKASLSSQSQLLFLQNLPYVPSQMIANVHPTLAIFFTAY